MDFVVGLPQTRRENDSIWVIVARLTKSTHFIPVKFTFSAEEHAILCINKILTLHSIPLSITLDRGALFTSQFWRSFKKGLGTQVKLSTTFHPKMDGQAENTIKTL